MEQTRYSDAATRTHAELAHGAAVRAGWIVPLAEHEVPPSRISFTSYIAKKAAGQYRAIVDASARESSTTGKGVNGFVDYRQYTSCLLDDITVVMKEAVKFRR